MAHSLGDFLDDPRWPIVHYWWYRKRREALHLVRESLREIRDLQGGEALFVDIGCGSGKDLRLFAKSLGPEDGAWRFLGCDADPECETLFHKELALDPVPSQRIEFRLLDITRPLPFEDRSVDVVYCSELLEHLQRPEALLSEFARVLRPRGICLVTTPNQPTVFEWGYYTRQAQLNSLGHGAFPPSPVKSFERDGDVTELFDHVSVKTIAEWDRLFSENGLIVHGRRRGALRYELPEWMKQSELILGAYFLLEGFIDLFPCAITARFGSGMIARYSLRTAEPR